MSGIDDLPSVADDFGMDPDAHAQLFEDLIHPVIEQMRAEAVASRGSAAGVWSLAMNRRNPEAYLYGIDRMGREFALSFTPDEFRSFVGQATAMRDALGSDGRPGG